MTAVTRVATSVSALSGSWTSATAATLNSDNAAYATITGATKNTTIGELALSGFDFDSQIPSGATIDQVELIVDWKVSTTGSVAILGTAYEVSTVAGTYQENSAEPTTDTTNTYDVTALRSWTRADLLDAAFKLRLRARQGNSATSVVYSFDYAAVRVNYTAATAPNAPTVATPSHIGGNVLGARWTAPASGPAPTGYKLTVATDSGFTSIVSGYNALDVGNVLFKLVTGLSPSTTYYYKVVAYNAVGDSTASGTQTTGTIAAAAFRDAVLNKSSLVAYFRLGDAAVGTLKDEAGGGDGSYGTGTSVNQTGLLTSSEPGAKAVYFDDNIAHFGTVAHRSNLALTYPFTILVFTKPDRANGSSGSYDRVLAKPNTMGSNSAPWNDYGIGAYGGASKFFFSYSISGSEQVLTADNDIVQGTTYMVTVTAASGAQKLYINKTLQAASGTSTTNPGASGQPLRFGQRNDLDNKYKGTVEEVAIFSAALTLSEIEALYDAAIPSTATYSYTGSGGLTLGGAATIPVAAISFTVGYSLVGGPDVFGFGGSSSTTFSYTGSGGLTFSGTATLKRSFAVSGTGSLTLAGSAILKQGRAYLATGGLTFSGSATLKRAFASVGSGGLSFAGSATLKQGHSYAASGGLTFSGAAVPTFSLKVLGSGGLTFAGAVSLKRAFAYVGSGGLTLAGAALPKQGHSYTASGGLTFSGSVSSSGAARPFTIGLSTIGGPDVFGLGGSSAVTYSYSGSGGFTLAGSGVVVRIAVYRGGGTIALAGSAQTSGPAVAWLVPPSVGLADGLLQVVQVTDAVPLTVALGDALLGSAAISDRQVCGAALADAAIGALVISDGLACVLGSADRVLDAAAVADLVQQIVGVTDAAQSAAALGDRSLGLAGLGDGVANAAGVTNAGLDLVGVAER